MKMMLNMVKYDNGFILLQLNLFTTAQSRVAVNLVTEDKKWNLREPKNRKRFSKWRLYFWVLEFQFTSCSIGRNRKRKNLSCNQSTLLNSIWLFICI